MGDNTDQQGQKAHSSAFPNPPLFWKDFTPENITRIAELRATRAEETSTDLKDLPIRTSAIPDELINLQPPAEPSTGTWRVLGGQYSLDDKLPSLEEVNIKRLASAHNDERDGKHLDRAFELKRMAKSLLLNFLELVGVMSITPEDSTAKVDDLRTLLMNFHHVLNEYRPHQARESGIALMQSHLDRTRAETAAIRAQVDSAKRVLEGLGSIDILQASPTSESASKGNEQSASNDPLDRREREVWEAADELFL
ncbi:mediator of RNA polymerase II transcription subunit 7 [Verticillium alfalfae VaMs.102]|uniref:Mediator of RNA polymerase II transcription subunit 7 n=1 Tax=Verticillium alfalfae (strain VaMs.102 / ATCC MYA-4576 / FGSC 10136) TaxID=526221 RepID=C9SYN0_VERA1|nr:mediator of RNA polymerase II transcription subunit 7 [Verticillium alfalfae VaMs.102]EEY23895.1 mediator of RNA polymerase II transcription subunit 7 [Verticillium alfalfae VaMs.102]